MNKRISRLAAVFAAVFALSFFAACSGDDDKPNSDPVAVTGVSLNPTTMDLSVGDQGKALAATVQPNNATDKSVTWKSSQAGVVNIVGTGATVTVNPAAEGTTTITVTTQDGNKTATCLVTVTGDASVAVTGVSLPPALSLVAGAAGSLAATIEPPNATNKAVTWDSSNKTVATVTGSGLTATVSAMAEGTSNITVVAADGGWTATCVVTVTDPNTTVSVTDVTLSPTMMGLTLGGSGQSLTAIVSPADATNKNVTWGSSPGGVVTITGTGATVTVSPVAEGTATITVTTVDGSKTATCAVTVASGGAPVVYIGGYFGLYANADHDGAIGDQGIYAVGVDALGKVHAAGQRYDSGAAIRWAPVYYLDGAMTLLPMRPDAREGWASSIFVTEDGHAYVAGYQENNPYYSKLALLWLDGELVELQGVGEVDGSGEVYGTRANAVCMHNGVVYVAGMAQDASHANHGAIWVDGVKHTMPYYTELVDMAIDAVGGIYVMGGSQIYKVAPDLASMQEVPHTGGTKSGMCVDGTDLYVVGSALDDALYWKNGTLYELPRPTGADWSWADIVFARDGVVYIGGTRSVPGVHRVQLWVNGQPVAADDPIAIKESFTDPTRARPLAIHAR